VTCGEKIILCIYMRNYNHCLHPVKWSSLPAWCAHNVQHPDVYHVRTYLAQSITWFLQEHETLSYLVTKAPAVDTPVTFLCIDARHILDHLQKTSMCRVLCSVHRVLCSVYCVLCIEYRTL
jgi:hypothetical protein